MTVLDLWRNRSGRELIVVPEMAHACDHPYKVHSFPTKELQ